MAKPVPGPTPKEKEDLKKSMKEKEREERRKKKENKKKQGSQYAAFEDEGAVNLTTPLNPVPAEPSSVRPLETTVSSPQPPSSGTVVPLTQSREPQSYPVYSALPAGWEAKGTPPPFI
jgi:hypothetical protein